MCQPPAAPAASSSPCSTLSCRTFSDLVGCHQAAPQAAGGGPAAPLSCGPWHQQHLQPQPWEEAHKVFNIQSHAGKNQQGEKTQHLSRHVYDSGRVMIDDTILLSLPALTRTISVALQVVFAPPPLAPATGQCPCLTFYVVSSSTPGERSSLARLSFFRLSNPTWMTKLSGSIPPDPP